jgi:hypothetical protein
VKRFSLAAILLLLIPAVTFAQGNPGPFGGLFGRTPSRVGVDTKVFEIRGSAGGQWNDTLHNDAPDRPEPPFTGASATSGASATFARRSDRLNFQMGSNVEYQHSLASDRTSGTSVDGGVALTGRLTTRVSAEMAVNYRQSPYYQFYPTFQWRGPGLWVPGLPYEVTTIGYRGGTAHVGGSYQYSRSGTLSATASRGETWFPTSPNSDSTMSRYEGLWTRRLNRDFALRLGYGRQEIQVHSSPVAEHVEEQIEAGVDFNKALTIVPRTTLAFTTHTSIIRRPDHDTGYRLNGEFLLSRRFRRTWRVEFSGRRGTDFLPGFVQPLFVDGLGLSMSGMLSNRIEFVTLVDGRRGVFGYDAELGRFEMAGSTTNVNIAITRHLGIYGRYGFYHQDTPSGVSSIAATGRLSRQSISAGISTWIPIFVRERTPIDSR